MSVERLRYGYGVFIIPAERGPSARLVSIGLWYRENKMLHFNNDQRLNKIAVDCIAHPCPSCLDLQPSVPLRMPSINLILKVWLGVLAKEYRAPDLIFGPLTRFHIESERNKIGSQDCENLVARQAFFQL